MRDARQLPGAEQGNLALTTTAATSVAASGIENRAARGGASWADRDARRGRHDSRCLDWVGFFFISNTFLTLLLNLTPYNFFFIKINPFGRASAANHTATPCMTAQQDYHVAV